MVAASRSARARLPATRSSEVRQGRQLGQRLGGPAGTGEHATPEQGPGKVAERALDVIGSLHGAQARKAAAGPVPGLLRILPAGPVRSRPRKASSRASYADPAAGRSAANRTPRSAGVTTARATGSRSRASREGIGVPRPVARPTSQPCTVISRAAVATTSEAGTVRSPTVTACGAACAQAPSRAQARSCSAVTRFGAGAGRRTSTQPTAASVKASRASPMWSRSASRVHAEQGVGRPSTASSTSARATRV